MCDKDAHVPPLADGHEYIFFLQTTLNPGTLAMVVPWIVVMPDSNGNAWVADPWDLIFSAGTKDASLSSIAQVRATIKAEAAHY